MPNALATTNVTEYDLKTLEGGKVNLKRMTYGQKLERQGMIKVQFGGGNRRNSDFKGELEMANRIATYYEFQHCIVSHNLTGENDVLLDLSAPGIIDQLDPRIGEEISNLISELNNFEDDQGN